MAGAFSLGGKTVLTGSEDNTARLWRVDTGEPLTPPLEHDVVKKLRSAKEAKGIFVQSSDGRIFSLQERMRDALPFRRGTAKQSQ